MRTLLLLFCFSLATSSWAESIKSPIHSVEGQLIKFDNGRVAFINPQEKNLLSYHDLADKVVEAEVDHANNLLSLTPIGEKQILEVERLLDPPAYEPTVINGLAEANKIFNRLNSSYRRASECSNRAHVWSHEEFTKNGIKSQKAFLFFTNSYIIRNKFKWWYHVATMMQVKHDGKTQGYVFDYMFDHAPKTMVQWQHNFIFSKKACLDLVNFSDYDLRADQTQDCYQKVGTMYDWNPTDFKNQEQGRYKAEFSMGEVRAAYGEAF